MIEKNGTTEVLLLELLAAALALTAAGCDELGYVDAPSPVYLVRGGAWTVGLESGERQVDILDARSENPAIVRVDGLDGGSVAFSGVSVGDAVIVLYTDVQRLELPVFVRAPDGVELVVNGFPWPPCERFLPGSREDGLFRWYSGAQQLEGVRADVVFESSEPSVATVTCDEYGQGAISYLAPGTVSVVADGVRSQERRVVDPEEVVSVALWVDPGELLIDEGDAVEPFDASYGSYTFLVNGRDADGALVCPHGAPHGIEAAPPPEAGCSFTASCDYLCEFWLSRTAAGTCTVDVAFGLVDAAFSIAFEN